jgi:hypothetical protein
VEAFKGKRFDDFMLHILSSADFFLSVFVYLFVSETPHSCANVAPAALDVTVNYTGVLSFAALGPHSL